MEMYASMHMKTGPIMDALDVVDAFGRSFGHWSTRMLQLAWHDVADMDALGCCLDL